MVGRGIIGVGARVSAAHLPPKPAVPELPESRAAPIYLHYRTTALDYTISQPRNDLLIIGDPNAQPGALPVPAGTGPAGCVVSSAGGLRYVGWRVCEY
jgi:hypothetical protein